MLGDVPTTSSPPGPSPDELAPGSEVDLLLRLARRWRRLGMAESAELGLTPHQERALLAVARLDARHGGVRVSHLARHLGIAPRSATEVADALESDGLLRRSPDPTDRRAVLLTLTDPGRRTVATVRERRRSAAEQALARLDETDRAQLRRLLTALLDA